MCSTGARSDSAVMQYLYRPAPTEIRKSQGLLFP
jgi:hypothetical protein